MIPISCDKWLRRLSAVAIYRQGSPLAMLIAASPGRNRILLFMLFFAIMATPFLAAWQASANQDGIEPVWKKALEVDIKNGAPSSDICDKAMRRAGISNNVEFKNWAYSTARQYCPPGTFAKGGSARKPKSKKVVAKALLSHDCPAITLPQMAMILRGQQVTVMRGACYMRFN